MVANEIYERYLSALLETSNVWEKWSDAQLWTAEATRALVLAGRAAFPSGTPNAKGHRDDEYGRSEYLTLDVCVTDQTWGPPLFIAEHENFPGRSKIEYCAWKLLAVRARRRVLVAYYDTTARSENYVRSMADLAAAVLKVCEASDGKDIIVIGADYNATPSSEDSLRKAHTMKVVGVPPTHDRPRGHDVERIPSHPNLMTELVDYAGESPYR